MSHLLRIDSWADQIFAIEVGDLPGAPDDQPLYSADGSANWLDPSAVRGTCFGCTCGKMDTDEKHTTRILRKYPVFILRFMELIGIEYI